MRAWREAAGVDRSLDGAVGPTVGRDAAPQAIRRVVDGVPRMEGPPVVGADAGCGGRNASVAGQGRGQEPQARAQESGLLLTVRVVRRGARHPGADAGDTRKVSLGECQASSGLCRGGGRPEPPLGPAAGPQPGGHALSGRLSANESRGGGSSTASGPRTWEEPLPPQGLLLGRAPQVVSRPRFPSAPFFTPGPPPSSSSEAPPWTPTGDPERGTPGPEGKETLLGGGQSESPSCSRISQLRPDSPGVAVPVRGTVEFGQGAGLQRGRGCGDGVGHEATLHLVLVEDGGLWWALGVAACEPEGRESQPGQSPMALLHLRSQPWTSPPGSRELEAMAQRHLEGQGSSTRVNGPRITRTDPSPDPGPPAQPPPPPPGPAGCPPSKPGCRASTGRWGSGGSLGRKPHRAGSATHTGPGGL